MDIAKFSVLISVYKTENPEVLRRALLSIWEDQTLKPDEIVCVLDGPLPVMLRAEVIAAAKRIGDRFIVHELIKNVGLGEALSIGLQICSNDLVARMDTDDISHSNRFATQVKMFCGDKKLGVLGSVAREFSSNEEITDSIRMVPEKHRDIAKMAKFRNPMNHPSVMYRKSQVLLVGGPKRFVGFDDYYLWARMIQNGSKFQNVMTPLVSLRAGNDLMIRRSGNQYIRQEIKFQRTLREMGFLNNIQFLMNLVIRVVPRMLPLKIQHQLYLKVLRK